MLYLWFKSFHIVGVVVWFAGLFYLVRLFVYHVEAQTHPAPLQNLLKQQYSLMEKRLYHLITIPGMIVTIIMAGAMIITNPAILQDTWLQVKLGLVAILLGYHSYCGRVLRQLSQGQNTWSSQQLRGLNEVPTILLVAIVCLAVFKNALPMYSTLAVLGGLILVIVITIPAYGFWRRGKTLVSMSSEPELEPIEPEIKISV